MHHFYLPPEQCRGATLSLSGREAHHALHVLRLRRAEQVMVLDGEGQKLRCEVEAAARAQVELRVMERRLVSCQSYQIILAQAIPKGKLIETIIQKAAELGVFQIVPLAAQRAVAKLKEDDADQKLSKWRLVAIEAIKQCGSAWLPQVQAPATVEEFVGQRRTVDVALVGSLQSDSRHPREHFQAFERQHGRKPKSVSVAIGPEGDFTPKELSVLQSAGALPITLGPRVLRTDTAAVYCLSIINYELQSRVG